MEKKIGVFSKWRGERKHTSVRKQMNELLVKLSEMDPTDARYEPTQKAILAMNSMRMGNAVSRSKIFKAIAGVGITAGVAIVAHKIDNSDEIIRNKTSLGMWNKISSFIMPNDKD